MSNSIYSTRRGYLYQDKFVIYKFLEAFLNRNIAEVYADFPIENNKSHDLIIKHKESLISVYSIKSGNQNIEDKIEGIRQSFEDLLYYKKALLEKGETSVILNVIISPDLLKEIWQHYGVVGQIQKYQRYHSSAHQACVWLKDKFKFSDKEPREIYHYLKQFNFDAFFDDGFNNSFRNTDIIKNIDKEICNQIKIITTNLNVSSYDFELPDLYLYYEMLKVTCENSGSENDIIPKYTECMAKFFSLRKIIEDRGRPPGSLEDQRQKYQTELLSQLNQSYIPGYDETHANDDIITGISENESI